MFTVSSSTVWIAGSIAFNILPSPSCTKEELSPDFVQYFDYEAVEREDHFISVLLDMPEKFLSCSL